MATSTSRFVGWTAVGLAFTLICAAQEKKPPVPDRKFLSTTELVLVPVVVRDKSGSRVSGLAKDDFQLSEAGKPQNIAVFEEVKASTAQASRPAAASGVYSNLLQDQTNKRVARAIWYRTGYPVCARSSP